MNKKRAYLRVVVWGISGSISIVPLNPVLNDFPFHSDTVAVLIAMILPSPWNCSAFSPQMVRGTSPVSSIKVASLFL